MFNLDILKRTWYQVFFPTIKNIEDDLEFDNIMIRDLKTKTKTISNI